MQGQHQWESSLGLKLSEKIQTDLQAEKKIQADLQAEKKILADLQTEKILADLHFRKELVDKGLQRVKNFSWEKTAQDVLDELLSFNH